MIKDTYHSQVDYFLTGNLLVGEHKTVEQALSYTKQWIAKKVISKELNSLIWIEIHIVTNYQSRTVFTWKGTPWAVMHIGSWILHPNEFPPSEYHKVG